MKSNPKRSLRAAINDKCRECIYDPIAGAGTWREQVAACDSYKCPLFPVRPLATPSRDPEKAVSSAVEPPEQYHDKGAA